MAFRHEHGRLYDALEHTAQLAELAGHTHLASSLRRDRRDVAKEIAEDGCGLRLDEAEQDALTRIALADEEERAYKANDYGPDLVPRVGRR